MNKQMCDVCNNEFNIVRTHLNDSNELVTICSHCGAELMKEDEVELNALQLCRLDNIYNAVFEMCKVLTDNEELDYNMSYLGPITEFAVNTLLKSKVAHMINFPSVITNKDGSQYIEPYYYLNEEDE